jgi:hypothetical protein
MTTMDVLGLLLVGIGVGLVVEINAVGALARPDNFFASSGFGVLGAASGSYLSQFVGLHGSHNMGVLAGAVIGAAVLAFWNLHMVAMVEEV